MKDLDVVIAGLTGCIVGNCSNCEYGGDGCHRGELMKESLADLKRLDDLRKDMWDLANKNHNLVRKVRLLRLQRDQAWEKIARITGEREAAWLSESGEPVPEFPKEGM